MTLAIAGVEVSYDKFVNDVASRVVSLMREEAEKPEFISQREASRIFGRANVERWRRTGAIEPIKRPGKLEYRHKDLRKLFEAQQDYEKDV
ncbi:MAG: hypothetical protein K2K81_07225 [Muribaculaceae bacterium]|nr:hypothetical protein [Muribaculaceae bacterium]